MAEGMWISVQSPDDLSATTQDADRQKRAQTNLVETYIMETLLTIFAVWVVGIDNSKYVYNNGAVSSAVRRVTTCHEGDTYKAPRRKMPYPNIFVLLDIWS